MKPHPSESAETASGIGFEITKLQIRQLPIPMSGFNLQEMMQQAKQQAEVLQKKMEQTVVEASSGGGTVTVKMDGRKQVLGIVIDPEAVKAGDVEMLQDLVMAAINEAARKVDDTMKSSLGGMLGGLEGLL
ncbi:MAG: YbaB/EbfC family nucleoid-associated protein [Terriglobales bacterium]